MEYEIRIQYSTIADLKREAARLLGDDLDGLQRDLDKALDDAATLRESLDAAREKLAEERAEVERLRGILPARGPTVTDAVVGALLRAGWDNVARCLAEGRSTLADCVHSMSRCLDRSNPKDAALAVVLDAAVADVAPAPPAMPPIPGPTALDGVVGMLVRCNHVNLARWVVDGLKTPAEILTLLRSCVPCPVEEKPHRALIAALDALAARERCPVGHGVNDACAECAPNGQPPSHAGLGVRERLDMAIGNVWTEWAREQPHIGASATLAWSELSEASRDVYRRIGEQLFSIGLTAGRAEAKEEREALRRRVRDLERENAGLGDHARALEEEASHLAADLHHASEQGAAEMRERAAKMVCNEGRTGCMWAVPHLAQEMVDAILSLPLDGEKVEKKR